MIQGGGWSRLRTLDEHTKLARIAVDLPKGCDELFSVNVAKMRVSVPPSLREPLMAIASGVAAQASTSYRRAGRRSATVAPSRNGTDVSGAEPNLVSTLTPQERDLLGTVAGVIRDEFRDEPDIVRRLLSRIERLPADPVDSDTAIVPLIGRQASGSPVHVV